MMSSVHSQGAQTTSSASHSQLYNSITEAIANSRASVSSSTSSAASTVTVTGRPPPSNPPPASAVPQSQANSQSQQNQQQQQQVVYTPPSTASESDDDPFAAGGGRTDEIFGAPKAGEKRKGKQREEMMPFTDGLKDRTGGPADEDDVSSVFSSLQPPIRARNTGRSRKLSTDESRKEVRKLMGQSLKEAKEELERAKQEEVKAIEELRAQHREEISRITSQHRKEALWNQQKHAAELRNAKKHTGYGAELIQGLHKSYGQQIETLILEVAEAKNVIKSLHHRLGQEALDTSSDVARESPIPQDRPQSQNAELSPVNLQVNIRFVGFSRSFDVPSIVVPHGGISFTQLKTHVHCAVANYLAFLRSKDSIHSSSSESANLIYILSLHLETSVKLLFFGKGDVDGEEITSEKWAERGIKTDDLIACITCPPITRQPPPPPSAKGSVAPSVISAASRITAHRITSLDDVPPPPTASSTETARTSAIWGPAAVPLSERSYTRSTMQTFPFRTTETIPEVPSPEGSSVPSETASLVESHDQANSPNRVYDMAKELERINNEFDQLREGKRSVLGHPTGGETDKRNDGVNVRSFGAAEPLLNDDGTHRNDDTTEDEDDDDEEDEEEMRGEGVDLGVGSSNQANEALLSDTVRLLGKNVPNVKQDDESSDVEVGDEEHLYEMVGEGADGDEDHEEDPNKILKGEVTDDEDDEASPERRSQEDVEKEREDLLKSEKVPLYVNEFLMGPVLESTLEKAGKQREENPFREASRKRSSGASVASRATTQRSSIRISELLDNTNSVRGGSTQRTIGPKSRPSLSEVRYRDQPDENKSEEESIHLLGDDEDGQKDSDGDGEAATATPRPRLSRRMSSDPPPTANTGTTRSGGVPANPWGDRYKQQREERPVPSKQNSFSTTRSSGGSNFVPLPQRIRQSAPKAHSGQPKFGVYGFSQQQEEGTRRLSKEEWIAGTIAESAPLSRSVSPDSTTSTNPEFAPLSSHRSQDTSSVVSESGEGYSDEALRNKIRREMQERYAGISPTAASNLNDYLQATAIFPPGNLRRERSVSQASSMSTSIRNLASTAGAYYDPLNHQQAPPSVPFYTDHNNTGTTHVPPPPPPGFEQLINAQQHHPAATVVPERMNPFLGRPAVPQPSQPAPQLQPAPHLVQMHPNLTESQIYAAQQAFVAAGIDASTLPRTQFYEFATSTPDMQKQHLRMMMQNAVAAAATPARLGSAHGSAAHSRGHSLPVSPPPVGPVGLQQMYSQFWAGAAAQNAQANVVSRSMTPPVMFNPQGKPTPVPGGVGVPQPGYHPVYVYSNAPPPPPPHAHARTGQWPW